MKNGTDLIEPHALAPPGRDEVLFVALGGVGEIGMNAALYGHAGRWLMVDLGVTFGDETTPGIDVIVPDLAFIEAHRERLVGLVLTHAHEDHLGAVPYLWDRIRCPVYATPFTANFLRRKLTEEGLAGEVRIRELPQGARFEVGPFDLEYVTMAHSIPEPNALVIRTKPGTLLHTGDWKIDPDPVVGPPADEMRLRRLGDEGVLAMICDSTNALVDGATRSEAVLRQSLAEVISEQPNRVVFTCFASNIARLETIAKASAACGRRVALVGRSLRRMEEVARATGYLADVPPFLGEEMVGYLPREEVTLVCTGSQGEPRAALCRIAENQHRHVVLEPEDTVIFSSRTIPGNERSVERLHNLLIRQGVEVLTNRDRLVHVSGHPCRDELELMYRWVRPRFAIPVHGETKHLHAHCELAKECGVEAAMLAENGTVVRITAAGLEQVARVPTGRLTFDGRRLVPVHGEALSARKRMLSEGAATVTLVVDRAGGILAEPQISVKGLTDKAEAEELSEDLRDALQDAVEALPRPRRRDDEAIREAALLTVRRALKGRYGKRPLIDVHLVRLGP
jgi:ribonuclease J